MFVKIRGFTLQVAVHILGNDAVELRNNYRVGGDVNQALGYELSMVDMKYFHRFMVHIKSRRVCVLHAVHSIRGILMHNEGVIVDKIIKHQSGEDVVGERKSSHKVCQSFVVPMVPRTGVRINK